VTSPLPPRPLEHRDVRDLDDSAWLERLKRSVREPVQDGRRYGGFPEEHIQRWFVGSSHEHALEEAFHFYRFARAHLARRPPQRRASNRYLDFGCGWGRIGRFFLRDFERGDITGVDIDPDIIAFCRGAELPGDFLTVANGEPLPFADRSFELITAYSVFTHLPPDLFRFWMGELLRVTARGGVIVFTAEPPRFLDFVAAVDPAAPESGWHAALRAELGDIVARRRELAETGVTYLATGGGGEHRQPDVYGDTVVTADFIDRAARPLGRLRAYVDEPQRFWQAVALVQRVR
jgi:SAM-dependent methyltransferase